MAIQTFTAAQVLTAAQMNALQANDYNQTVSTKTASYTLVAADKGTRVVMNSASATTITVNTSLFSAGDTLVLQNISTGVCTVTAGTATVSTAGSLAIPQNGSGILYFTSAGVSIFYPSDSGSGTKIGQVVSAAKTDSFSSSSTSFTDITGLSVTITPTLATSKILVMASFQQALSGDLSGNYRFVRDSTAIFIGDTAGSRFRATNNAYSNTLAGYQFGTYSPIFLDSPATTSATTYKLQGTVSSGTFYINRNPSDADNVFNSRTASSITVMEVIV
jgi:hypothetical protein